MFRGVSKFKTSLLTNIQSKNNLTNNSQQLFRKASTVSAQAAFTDIEANRKVSSIEEQVNLTKKPEELQDRNKPFLEQKKASHDIIFGSHGLRTSFVRPLHKSKVMLGASTANLVSSNYHRGLSTAAAVDSSKSTTIPDFSAYKKKNDDQDSSRVFSYLIVGSTGALTAVGAKSFVTDFLANMGAAADVLALAKVEVDLTKVPEGKNLTVKWRGKPVFIRHRTPNEIEEANSVQMNELKDPQLDSQRTKKPEWLVMLGVCTHLGCVPIGEAGDYGGWYCPCHGSHYDISGRIRKGPAPLNLEVPDYDFPDENTLVVG